MSRFADSSHFTMWPASLRTTALSSIVPRVAGTGPPLSGVPPYQRTDPSLARTSQK